MKNAIEIPNLLVALQPALGAEDRFLKRQGAEGFLDDKRP
jgi:hypothetical protein